MLVHWLIQLMKHIHCAPLERGDWVYCLSIDISLRPDKSGFKATGAKVKEDMDSKICVIRDSDNLRYLRNPNPINFWTLPLLSCLSFHLENFDLVLYTCRPAGALMWVDPVFLYTYRPAGAMLVSWIMGVGQAQDLPLHRDGFPPCRDVNLDLQGLCSTYVPAGAMLVHWLIQLMKHIHCAPLEREDWAYCFSIDISLRWSEGRTVDGRGNLAPTIDQDALVRIRHQSADRTRSVNSSSMVIASGPSGLSILLTISDSSSRFSSSVSSST